MIHIGEKLSSTPILDTLYTTSKHPQNRRIVASAASTATVRHLVGTIPAGKPKQQISIAVVKLNDFIVVSKALGLSSRIHHFITSYDCILYENEKQEGASYPNNCQGFVDEHV
jgi:hypothetical protein